MCNGDDQHQGLPARPGEAAVHADARSRSRAWALLEKRLLAREWQQFALAEPPAGSDLKPVMGDAGLPIIGHMIEVFRGGPDFVLQLYRKHGPVHYSDSPVLPSVAALGPDATQAVFSNRNKDFSQRLGIRVIGPFFERGLMLLDFDEHMFHRRIMQEAFTRTRLTGYVEHIDSVASQVIANDWVANDPTVPLPSGGQGADARHRVGGVHGPQAGHRHAWSPPSTRRSPPPRGPATRSCANRCRR